MKRTRFVSLMGLVSLASVSASGTLRQTPADLIVLGGAIHTADARRPRVDAFAVSDGRFVAVGSRADSRDEGAATRVVDLAGDAVVPGLQDAHGHFLGLGASLSTLDLARHPESGEHHDEGRRAGGRRGPRPLDRGPRLGSERLARKRLAHAAAP